MMIFGDGVPLPDVAVQKLKFHFSNTAAKHDTTPVINDMRERFKELHSSTLDNFVRLTIVGAIVTAIVSINEQIVPFLTSDKTPLPGLVASWVYAGCTGVAILCVMLMVMPKYKEWRKGQHYENHDVGMQALYNLTHEQWWEFLRLNRRFVHRQQLITFERRVQHVGCVMAALAYIAAATAFALV